LVIAVILEVGAHQEEAGALQAVEIVEEKVGMEVRQAGKLIQIVLTI